MAPTRLSKQVHSPHSLSSLTSLQSRSLLCSSSVLERYCSCHPFLFVWSVSHGLVDECTWCPAGGAVWGGYITYGMWGPAGDTVWGSYITYGMWGLAGRCRSVTAGLRAYGHFWMGSSSLPIYCDVEKNYTIGSYHHWQNTPAITPFPLWWIMPSETVSPNKLFLP